MTILTFPTIRRPAQVSWRLRGNTQSHTSPLDGSTQTIELPGARWEATISWPSLDAADRRTLEAFLASLRGRAGRFHFAPPHGFRRATGTGTPVVSGAGQTGSTLETSGWAASAQAFKAGDFLGFEANSRKALHIVTADVTADEDGLASVPIAPPIRRSPNDEAAITIESPMAVFMLNDDAGGSMDVRPPQLGSVTLDIVEALV